MSEDTDTIAEFYTNVGIESYFDEYLDFDTRIAQLNSTVAALAEVQALSRGNINRNSNDQMAALGTALDLLTQYRTTNDAEARQSLATQAIESSDAALTSLIELIEAEKDNTSPNSLSYAFGALHYAILARMTVADTVQDGPLGAPGLLETLTHAATLLYDVDGPDGVYTTLLIAIGQDFEVVNVQGTSEDSQVNFDIISNFGKVGFSVEVIREQNEEDEDFLARTEAITEEQASRLLELEMENINADVIENIGQQITQWVANDRELVAGLHERIGTDGNDTEEGTALADYFSGLGGDDVYRGGDGPDALSGGEGNDILRGGSFMDMLVGGPGNDLIFGGEARSDAAVAPDGDLARFAGRAEEHTILGGVDYAVVIGPDGSRDKLFDISYLRFDDGDIALPGGNALDTGEQPFETLNKNNFDIGERVALLYEAALNRNGAIDLPGLNFYIDVTARDNLSDEFLAADLMTSPEFTDNFGDVNTLSNEAFLERIYLNVLDRESDAAGRQFYLDLLESGTISKALALADIAVSPENTQGSAEILMSLYETTTPETDEGTGIALDWSFIA